MEQQSVVGAICSSYDQYFDAEKKIADCIMERKEEVVGMTLAELAVASGTSDATVSRFCRRCGFKSFQNLKMTLAQEVAAEKGKDIQVSNDIERDDIAQSLQNILANKVAELTQTVSMIDTEQLAEVLELLEHARMVQVVAVGNTTPVAMDFAFKLNQIGITAVTGLIWEAQMALTLNLTAQDVLVIISNSGSSKRLQTMLEGAAERGVKTIVITNNAASPAGKAADYLLITATREKLLLGEFCFSRVSATMIVELLYLFLATGREDSYDKIRRHEKAIAEDKKA